MNPKFKEYQVEPSSKWESLHFNGYDGYDIMAKMEKYGWRAKSSWGKDGWDLGSWPYVIVYWRTTTVGETKTYSLVTYVEGDVGQWDFPTEELRNERIDEIAFFYWKHANEEWVKDYATIDDVPADSDLRGPVRFHLEKKEEAK